MKKCLMIMPALCCILFFSAHSADKHNDTLTIATDASYPPWHEIDKNGEFVGYEIDLAKEICKEANLKCQFEVQSFTTLISSVRFHKHDLLMAGMANNPNRQRVLNFSITYAKAKNTIALNATNKKVLDFCQSCPDKLDLANPQSNDLLVGELLRVFKGKKLASS